MVFWRFLGGQKEVQKVLDEYNKKGWYCVHFEWTGSRKYTTLKLIWVLIITFGTLGLLSYWSGFSIIFEKEYEDKNENKPQFKAQRSSVNSAGNKESIHEHKVVPYDT